MFKIIGTGCVVIILVNSVRMSSIENDDSSAAADATAATAAAAAATADVVEPFSSISATIRESYRPFMRRTKRLCDSAIRQPYASSVAFIRRHGLF